jgi:hypothetical protein
MFTQSQYGKRHVRSGSGSGVCNVFAMVLRCFVLAASLAVLAVSPVTPRELMRAKRTLLTRCVGFQGLGCASNVFCCAVLCWQPGRQFCGSKP